jgi:hypothetical protein
MEYEAPAVEHRIELEAHLGATLPSGQEPIQPVWRPKKPEAHEETH